MLGPNEFADAGMNWHNKRPIVDVAHYSSDSDANHEHKRARFEVDGSSATPGGGKPDDQLISSIDTCFGTISSTCMSTYRDSEGVTEYPVNITVYGNMLKLYAGDKYAGIINSQALAVLSRDFSVQFRGILVTTPTTKSKQNQREETLQLPRECVARVTIFGLKTESLAVGDILSAADLYLQHPSFTEYHGLSAPYSNPHYLLRPGAEMPNLQQLWISSGESSNKLLKKKELDQSSKNRFMDIFDAADGDEEDLSPLELSQAITVTASPRIKTTLKRYQLDALAMMVEKEQGIVHHPRFPSLWSPPRIDDGLYRHNVTGIFERTPRPVYGGVLADEMGLGKTLSMLALISWSLDSVEAKHGKGDADEGASWPPTLIVTPKTTLISWEEQIKRHIYPGKLKWATYHGAARKLPCGGTDVVLTTYQTMRSECAFKGPLYSTKWLRIVLDEAHQIRSRSTKLFQAACAIEAQYRWCLTGTPIQNSLDDFGALLSFVRVYPFGDKQVFDSLIAMPVQKDIPDGLRRFKILVRATCLRRTKKGANLEELALPTRTETIEDIELSPSDRRLYTFFQREALRLAAGLEDHQGKNILGLINTLRAICDHGENLLPLPALRAWQSRRYESIDWFGMGEPTAIECQTCGINLVESDESNGRLICTTCTHLGKGVEDPSCFMPRTQTHGQTCGRITVPPSAKVTALIRNLRQEQSRNNDCDNLKPGKSVVFSCWTRMLDLVQQHLELSGFNVRRIDGKSSLQDRGNAIEQFSENPDCTVMLASIESAGEGITLTAANYVHLLEPHWNPAKEAQAIARVHRIGQTRNVRVTRYITKDSVENHVQWVQEKKERLINDSLDPKERTQLETGDERWKVGDLRQLLGSA
ncbi:SNF2 family N-terminal domain-containing protein [Bombardia bombarda]|uniref:SNF2 family N-terminal domain-containing protein n=1 Tax=Bombardia bombarda TaxID=252184 RepID=A0AA40C9S7_9PEZI|nr:SNF2 family N-terminal domain-containing protein [Bombardia bombarda]